MNITAFTPHLNKWTRCLLPLAAMLILVLFTPRIQASESNSTTGYSYTLTIDDVVCQGNEAVSCDFITNKYYQRKGDTLDPGEIAEAKLRLGTLSQFREVNVFLKKGSQRNHVIVVFEVVEADTLQFELSTFFENYTRPDKHCNYVGNQPERLGLASEGIEVDKSELFARITDYNFLGEGKQLSLTTTKKRRKVANLNVARPENDISYFNLFSDTCVTDLALNDIIADQLSTALEYYDPHFLGFKKLFFIGQYEYSQNDIDANYFDYSNASSRVRVEDSFSNNDSYFSATIGSRFANYSFFSVSMQSYLNSNETGLGVAYGWNSQDDILFPTSGSFFRIQQSIERDGSRDYSISFQKNHLLSDNLTLSWGAGDGFLNSTSHQLGAISSDISANKTDSILFAKLSGILSKDNKTGAVSGWNVGLIGDYSKGVGVMANYIYHTDKLILNFGFNYYSDEGSN